MAKSICYLNGRYLDVEHATVPATDRGLLYGEGLFEAWRTYRGRPFALDEHLRRLARSARALGIPFDADEDWEGRSLALVRRNRAEQSGSVIRLTITRGSGPMRLAPPRTGRPTHLMLWRELEPGLTEARESGVAVHMFEFGAGVAAGLRRLKTINYLSAVMGKAAAAERGCFEAIYRLTDTTLLEGTTTNVFVVKRGTLITPPVASGVLPGVTRALVLRLARRIAPVREGRITANDLLACDEAFLTSTSIEIVPIVRVGRQRAAGGRPGPLTRELQRRYRALVARRLELEIDALGD